MLEYSHADDDIQELKEAVAQDTLACVAIFM
jgi:hypothetical protein